MTARTPFVKIIDPMVVECLRRLTPAQKLSQAFSMWDFAIAVMTASIRNDHPQWEQEEIQEEILRRLGRTRP